LSFFKFGVNRIFNSAESITWVIYCLIKHWSQGWIDKNIEVVTHVFRITRKWERIGYKSGEMYVYDVYDMTSNAAHPCSYSPGTTGNQMCRYGVFRYTYLHEMYLWIDNKKCSKICWQTAANKNGILQSMNNRWIHYNEFQQ
jgi:hypothetical protein